jgi:hypothetical protein
MSRNFRWLLVLPAVAVTAGLAGCGTIGSATPPTGAGKSAGINMKLTTVPVIRSVTVSPAKGTFEACSGGNSSDNTASSGSKLGYPDGHCWYGNPEPHGRFPITITNAGIASKIDVSGQPAYPSDDGDSWNLCNTGKHPATKCTGARHEPGDDQYKLQNFSPDSGMNYLGISKDWQCDLQFGQDRTCAVEPQGAFQTEGLELIGPASTSDNSTSWTVTVIWMPVPQ